VGVQLDTLVLKDGSAENRLVHRPRENEDGERFSGACANRAQHVLGEPGGQAAVDHDHAARGDDKPLVGDVAAIRAACLVARAEEHMHAVPDVDRLGKGRCGAERCGEASGGEPGESAC
jgi:hypothetical protein